MTSNTQILKVGKVIIKWIQVFMVNLHNSSSSTISTNFLGICSIHYLSSLKMCSQNISSLQNSIVYLPFVFQKIFTLGNFPLFRSIVSILNLFSSIDVRIIPSTLSFPALIRGTVFFVVNLSNFSRLPTFWTKHLTLSSTNKFLVTNFAYCHDNEYIIN